jgi:IS30 family transposase
MNKSSIYREIKRNATKRGVYSANYAQMLSDGNKERFKCTRKFESQIKKNVDKYIGEEQWSPKQIVGYCKNFNIPMVSHERIYQYVRLDKANGGKLYENMRHKLKHRKRPVSGRHVVIKNKVFIDERPAIINNKDRFGDWEIDTIVGKENKGAIVTIVERTTGFFMMKRLPHGKACKGLSEELISMLLPYKKHIHSITADNGSEFADHKTITKKLEAKVYFAHPYSSWERGLSEYTNKLIRQYIPKKTIFKNLNDEEIQAIQVKINRRPREKLGFKTPVEIFYKLAS